MNSCFQPTRLSRLVVALVLVVPTLCCAETLTYNGSLQDSGKPANGRFDLRVRLFDLPSGGLPVGEPITLYGVQVRDGRFQVPIELAQPLPKQGSLWLEAQLQVQGQGEFQPLNGRQEISAAPTGAMCWDTAGNTGLAFGTLGITDAGATLLTLQNSTSNVYLRRNGGIEQSGSTASGDDSAAWGDVATAAAPNSFAAGRSSVPAAHSFSTVFADGQAGAFSSTAANQFLIRAQNGVGINTGTSLGTLTVRRGGASGVAITQASTIATESDVSNYVSLLSPTTAERGLLFADTTSSANGGIIFNSIAPGFTNPDGLTFRTGGNVDRLRITSNGVLLLNQQFDPPNADVSFRSTSGGNSDFFMNLRSASGNLGTLSVSDVPSAIFQIQAETGDLVLRTNTVGRSVRTSATSFGVSRPPAANAFEVEGNASKTVAGSWLANSDRRIKQDIQPVADALRRIRQLQPVSFRYSDDYRALHPGIKEQRYFNVIAQEFAEVFPDAVTGSGEYLPGTRPSKANEILQVDTYPATITAIAAIQELDAVNEAQDREVAELKRANAELRQRLAELEQLIRAAR